MISQVEKEAYSGCCRNREGEYPKQTMLSGQLECSRRRIMVSLSNSMREEGLDTLSQVEDKSRCKGAWKREECMGPAGTCYHYSDEEYWGRGKRWEVVSRQVLDHKELWTLAFVPRMTWSPTIPSPPGFIWTLESMYKHFPFPKKFLNGHLVKKVVLRIKIG